MAIFGKISEYPKLFSIRPSELAVCHQYILYVCSKLTGWPVDTRIKHQEVTSHLPVQEAQKLVVKSIAVCYDSDTGIQTKKKTQTVVAPVTHLP